MAGKMGEPMIKVKRVYEESAKGDGTRVLVERLWPRGSTKGRAAIHLWLKDVAPSPELRTWFAHDPAKWAEFRRRYRAELARPEARAALATIREKAGKGNVTLVYSAHDERHNSAVVLNDYLARGGRARRVAAERPRRRAA
jgi:uncharacterized protein YeaO (DUF488 family)